MGRRIKTVRLLHVKDRNMKKAVPRLLEGIQFANYVVKLKSLSEEVGWAFDLQITKKVIRSENCFCNELWRLEWNRLNWAWIQVELQIQVFLIRKTAKLNVIRSSAISSRFILTRFVSWNRIKIFPKNGSSSIWSSCNYSWNVLEKTWQIEIERKRLFQAPQLWER